MLDGDTRSRIARVVEEQTNRLKLAEHGYLPKSRLLFWGPPGCGKTLAAHYLSYQLGLPLGVLRISATISSFLGETASRIQQAFDAARQSPMILLLDEVDAIAKDRDDENDVGELKRVVNSLLQALDSFRDGKSILVAASNHQYLLDSAVWRRFDTFIRFSLPGEAARAEFMAQLLSGVRLSGSLGAPTKASRRLSYAEIERAVTEAVKTMILTGRDELRSTEVTEELNSIRKLLSQARKRPLRTRRDS
jgi:SpoVK/Ycf46/Vps4 family AAA+-type ATPase